MEKNSGVYQFVFRMKKDAKIVIGALGTYMVPAAYYVYSGTAQRGLRQRIARHASKDKPKKWHIDYLTCHPAAEPVAAFYLTGVPGEAECDLAIRAIVNADFLLPGVGISDCRYCPSHICGFFGSGPSESIFSGLEKLNLS